MGITFLNSATETSLERRQSWGNQDIADFYRAVDVLRQSGLAVEIDSGMTDEGDPWFVFFRSDNEDVIAHFARIDGLFIAVSSINQKVFKGPNIRTIVDQMLRTNPLLLPKNAANGQLLLHPVAAVTAFLAAAFVLTLEDIEPTTIPEIISVALIDANDDQVNSLGETGTLNKSDTLKALLPDASSVNYNVAILGAALIAHEINQTGIETNGGVNTQQGVLGDVGKHNERTDDPNSNDESNDYFQLVHTAQNKIYQLSQVPLDSVKISQDYSHLVGMVEVNNTDKENNDFLPEEINLITGQNFMISYDVAWDYEIAPDTNANKAFNSWSNENLRSGSFSVKDHVSLEAGKLKVSDFSGTLSNLVSIDISEQKGFETSDPKTSDSLVSRLDTMGVLALVSLEAQKFGENLQTPVFASLATLESNFLQPIVSMDTLDPLNERWTEAVEKTEEIDFYTSPTIQLPILGHSLGNQAPNLDLTDALDVLFYQGGDVKISNFELGTDLLWFFLSPNELAEASKSVNQAGDLVLDFGDIGMLTFLGMVENSITDLYA